MRETKTEPVRNRGGLLIICCDDGEPQFRGIRAAAAELARRYAARHLTAPLDQRDRETMADAGSIIVCGHGAPDRPRIGTRHPLVPSAMDVGPSTTVYLLACHQGQPRLRTAWAAGCGLPRAGIKACPGETESALSTMLLVHLLRDGLEALPIRFNHWRAANTYLQPWFPRIRRAYERRGGDPVATLGDLEDVADLTRVHPFLKVVRTEPRYFQGLK